MHTEKFRQIRSTIRAAHPEDGEVAFYIHPRDRERFEEERGAFAAAHGIRVVVRPDIPEGSIMTMAFRDGDDDPWEDTYELGEETWDDDDL